MEVPAATIREIGQYNIHHKYLEENCCPLLIRWMIEANISFSIKSLNHQPIRSKYFCAFAFSVWPTLAMRVYRVVTETIFLVVRIPYRKYMAVKYDLDNDRNPQKPPNTVTEVDRVWQKLGHEWVDLFETFRCWVICGISIISPALFSKTIDKIARYYMDRVADDIAEGGYVRTKIEIGNANASIRQGWKETRKLPRPLLVDNVSVPGVRAPEDIWNGSLE